MRNLSKKIVSLFSFLVELVVYAGFVTAYFFLVLHFLGDWIKHIFDHDKTLYAFLAVGLISVQGVVLERLTTALLWVIWVAQAVIRALVRLARPHETITRPREAPGLLVYRFAGPLFLLNAAFFAERVHEVVDAARPPVRFFLVNAEAIVDIDINAVEVLEQLYLSLKRQGIVLGLCEVKGNFRETLLSTDLTRQPGFKLYPNVITAVRELSQEQHKEKKSQEQVKDKEPAGEKKQAKTPEKANKPEKAKKPEKPEKADKENTSS